MEMDEEIDADEEDEEMQFDDSEICG